MEVIKSINYNQTEIIQNIIDLHCPQGIEIDITYGNGSFYKDIKSPQRAFDLEPLFDFVEESCSTNLPLKDFSVNSIMFDPPFLTYIKKGREHNSIMAKRFSGYWSYKELEDHYKKTLNESSRVLKKKGILIFKCQDIIHNHKMHSTHNKIVQWSESLYGFRVKDIFILLAKNRMPVNSKGKQQHSRQFHSYFLVLEKF